MMDDKKKAKRKYKTPIIVDLGGLARGIGYCAAGSSADPGYCTAGFAAASACTGGATAITAACTGGTVPGA